VGCVSSDAAVAGGGGTQAMLVEKPESQSTAALLRF